MYQKMNLILFVENVMIFPLNYILFYIIYSPIYIQYLFYGRHYANFLDR